MVFGADVGVVLRARKGRNILVQAHGLDVKAVTQAATEVAAVLEGDLPSSIELLDTGVGTQHALACGHLRVLGNRYAVVYRLLHQVLVVVVSRSHANVFSSLNLVSAISRLLVAEAKSVELTPERLLKKYAQVYLSVDALVNRGSLDLVGALLEANSHLDSLSPEALKQRRGKQAAEAAAAAAAATSSRQIARRVPQPNHDHGRFSFPAPAELTSLQVNMPVYQLPELPAPDRPLPQPVRHVSALPVTEEGQQEPGRKDSEPALEQQEAPPVAKQPSVLLSFSGPPLLLQEAWQVEVCGSKIVRAGLTGAVRWAAPEAKALAGSTPFMLQPPPDVPPRVAAALKCALAAVRGTKLGTTLGCFLADTLSPLPAAAPLLQYTLPATAGVLPLLVRMNGGLVELPQHQHKAEQKQEQEQQAKKKKGKQESDADKPGSGAVVVLLSLQWHVPRELKQAAKDLSIDLHAPPGFGAPRRVEPVGATWSPSQSLLRWSLPTPAPGAAGCAVAAFRVRGGGEAAAAGLARCHAVLRLRGEGSTVTGVQLAQSRGGPSNPLVVEAATNSWAAFVLARPSLGATA